VSLPSAFASIPKIYPEQLDGRSSPLYFILSRRTTKTMQIPAYSRLVLTTLNRLYKSCVRRVGSGSRYEVTEACPQKYNMILWEGVRYLCSYAPCKLWTLRTDTPFSLHNKSCFSGHSGLIATILANASQILAPKYSSCLAIWGGAARWCSGNHLESNILDYTHITLCVKKFTH
jgi:hypothetical protein